MTYLATCHCGATRIEVSQLPEAATECDCTFCSKRGALWVYYETADFRVLAEGAPATYAPSGVNRHHFCAVCGCTTYSLAPDWSQMGEDADPQAAPLRPQLNLRLLDEVNVAALPVVRVDGRSGW